MTSGRGGYGGYILQYVEILIYLGISKIVSMSGNRFLVVLVLDCVLVLLGLCVFILFAYVGGDFCLLVVVWLKVRRDGEIKAVIVLIICIVSTASGLFII